MQRERLLWRATVLTAGPYVHQSRRLVCRGLKAEKGCINTAQEPGGINVGHDGQWGGHQRHGATVVPPAVSRTGSADRAYHPHEAWR
jgi:hypothetical protein